MAGGGVLGAAAAPGWLRICCRALLEQGEMLISATSTYLPFYLFNFWVFFLLSSRCFSAVPSVPVQGSHPWGPQQSRGLGGGRGKGWSPQGFPSQTPARLTSQCTQGSVPSP